MPGGRDRAKGGEHGQCRDGEASHAHRGGRGPGQGNGTPGGFATVRSG
jgi:hypothetical protein